MEVPKEAVICAAGLLAGTMNAIAGGGTMVSFPALLWAGLGGLQANVTSTVALFPGMPWSAWLFRKHLGGLSQWLRVLGPVALIMGFAGGVLLLWFGSRAFDFIVPWLLLLATVLLVSNDIVVRWLRRHSKEPGSHHLGPWGIAVFAGVGIYGGYFGAGIGIMMLATLGLLGLRNMNQMNSLKVILALLMNLAAVVWFIFRGEVNWHWCLWLMGGSIAGYGVGSHVAQRIPGVWVRGIAALIGLAICIQLFVKQCRGA